MEGLPPSSLDQLTLLLLTLEKNIVGEVRSEVDSVMKTVETRVQYAVMTAIENLVFPRLELATKSVNASSGHKVVSVVSDPY